MPTDNIVFGKLDPPPIELIDMFPYGGGGWFTGLWTVVQGLMTAIGLAARGSVTTTDATADVTLCELELYEGRSYMLFAEVAVAQSGLSSYGAYQAFAVGYRSSGGNAAVKSGSLTVLSHSNEADSACDVKIAATSTASSRVRIAVTGKSGTTYNWRGVLRAIPNKE